MGTLGGGQRSYTNHLRFEAFVPSSGWSEDANNHILFIDLPGFHREEVKLHIDDGGRIVASGERQLKENIHLSFEQFYKIPENSNIEEATAKFDDEILYITIPKKEDNHFADADQNQNQAHEDDATFHEEKHENGVEESDKFGGDEETEVELGDGRRGGGEMIGDGGDGGKFHDASFAFQVNEESPLRKLGLELKRHKGIITTAILAFSLGVFVSNKFHSNEK